MIELLALASAVLYGSADFFGGLTARRANTIATVVWSQFAGLVLLLLAIPFLPATTVSSRDWIWGFVAGLTGGIGVAFLYRALAVGTMAVVAPTTAVIAAMIPVAFGFAIGERLRPLTLAGVALALIAIFLVSRPPRLENSEGERISGRFPPGFGLALLSGISVGIFFLSLARTSMAAGMWPLVAARISSIGLFAIIAVVAKRTLRMDRTASATASLGGALDMAANAVYMTAARIGPLSIVVTLASLYPASTVILARILLKEHLSRTQIAGIACALLAVVLIVAKGAVV
ncbi:MAG: EamA family transporter [Chthoniobacterales bacterium]